MARIGEYRLKAYELLFSTPLCEYKENAAGKSIYNILIIGNGWMGNEMFKAVFWAGQSVDSDLNITVASQNAEKYGELALSTGIGASLPALKTYIEKKKYANLRFVDIDIEKGADEAGLEPLGFNNNCYNYIVVSLGDAEHNWLAATELLNQIGKARNATNHYKGKIIINVFNEFSDAVDIKDWEVLICEGEKHGIKVQLFGGETNETKKELDRMARNINFAYAMKYDQRCNKKKVDKGFEDSLYKEFIASPMDYDSGDVCVIDNFLGANYTADSSFAAAVHIPVKLAICKEAKPERDSFEIMKEAIQKKNSIYRKLVALEHRRWNAYMIMRGFRAPTKEEEAEILYHHGNMHQAKKERLHICICDCKEDTSLDSNFDQYYKKWIEKKCPSDYPSELDRASLRIHQLVSKLTEEVNVNEITANIKGENPEYSNLRRAILKLANDEDHSLALYQRSFEEAYTYATGVAPYDVEIINKIDTMMLPFKVYNSRTDFLGLDKQLIEMLPFVIWYGKKYKTVITVSDGSVTATHDVIIPTLFCAENAVYIGRAVGSNRYQKSINDFFKSRGSNTVPKYYPLTDMNVGMIYDTLEKLIVEYGVEKVIINCVPSRGAESALAIGKLMEKYNNQLTVVQYVPHKGIVSFSDDKNIGIGLDNKSYSFSEFVKLMGGCVTNEFSLLYDSTQYDKLVALFKKYCDSIKITTAENKTKNFNPWAVMTNLMSSSAKDYVFETNNNIQINDEIKLYHGEISNSIFVSGRIGSTLRQLQEYMIIQNYKEKQRGNLTEIEFEYVDKNLAKLLQSFDNTIGDNEAKYKGLKFIPLNGGLKVTNRHVKDIKLIDLTEDAVQISTKIDFLNDLLSNGYIRNMEIDNQGKVSFVFKDEPTMHLFKSQGTVFELIIYHFMRESGLFDDCETGVKISWDVNDEPLESILLDELRGDYGGQIGYKKYIDARAKVLYGNKNKPKSVMNEIDVIGISGMEGVMVSCKTSEKSSMQWIYEISSVSDRFQSHGVMAVSSDIGNANNNQFLERATQMNIPVWGTETLWNPEKMRDALRDITTLNKRN